jgi:hypothetical protein
VTRFKSTDTQKALAEQHSRQQASIVNSLHGLASAGHQTLMGGTGYGSQQSFFSKGAEVIQEKAVNHHSNSVARVDLNKQKTTFGREDRFADPN